MKSKKHSTYLAYFLAILTIGLFIFFIILRQVTDYRFEAYYSYAKLIGTGLFNTIIVSLIALVGSLVLGFFFYLLSISKIKYLNALTDVFKEIIYGTPLLVLIVITAFVIGPAFGMYNRTLLGVMALIFYMTPYMMNVYKSSIASISEEQYLTMNLFGFTPYQRYRYIIIPQVVRVLMPPMMNNFSLIIKGSALLNVLAFTELFYALQVAQSKTFAFVEGYLIMWVLYLLITIPLSQVAKWIERKWSL